MWVIAGLGNPGVSYARHRHNIGFMAADAIADRYRFPAFSQKFSAQVATGEIGGARVALIKPQSYMNLSGQPIGELMRFHKIPPERLIVLHDELDLPLAKLRVKQGGGHGGHNGLKSVDAHVGQNYWRVRLGIGHPGDKSLVSDYVLSDFLPAERAPVKALLDAVAEHIPVLMAGDEAGFMNKIVLEKGK